MLIHRLIAIVGVALASLTSCKQEVTRIWDQADHSAFTSLIQYDGYLYCAFREGTSHVDSSGENGGTLRIIKSVDGDKWESVDSLSKPGYDLRDASLVVLPTGELALYCGVSEYSNGDLLSFQSHYSIMKDGKFTQPQLVMTDFNSRTQWLWKVRNHNNILYTVSYGGGEWRLLSSEDGAYFKTVKKIELDSNPNEADISFDGEQMIIAARSQNEDNSYIGRAMPPYQDWIWNDCGYAFGGPEICGEFVGSRRYKKSGTSMVLFRMGKNDKLIPLLTLPSGGDCSYPGMVRIDDTIYMSYYSSHEEKTAIYFTKIDVKKLRK